MAKFNLDLRGDNAETMDSGGNPIPGCYAARLEDSYDDHNQEGITVLEFVIILGAFIGRKLFYRLSNPDLAINDQKARTAINRIKMIASRLGLIGEEDAGKEVDVDFCEAIGWEGVVEFEERTYPGDDGSPRTTRGIAYSGIYPSGHKDLAKKTLPAELQRFVPAVDAAAATEAEKKPRGRKAPAVREPVAAGANGRHTDIPLDDI